MTKKTMTPAEGSSLVTGHHYDADKRELTVDLKNGSRHVYADVGIDKAEAFSGAASKGAFFNDKIRGAHASRRVK